MLIFLIIFIGILLYGVGISKKGTFFEDYSAPKQTAAINGIFTILIFLSHASQYLRLNEAIDEPYLHFRTYLGQLVVVSFLFFSGYGMMASISKKGRSYIKDIPSKRLFKTWYHFVIAIILFLFADLCMGKIFSIKNILLSFIGLFSVGNSSWYMFVTFVMYILIFLAFSIAKDKKLLGALLTLAFTFIFAFIEYKCGLANRFFNTVFCFPAGMLFSLAKPKIDKWVMKSDAVWCISLAVVLAGFLCFGEIRYLSIAYHNIFSILAVLLIMLITMKFKIGNPVLDFFGRHIFSIFILQRIPMIVLRHLGMTNYKYLFIVLSLIITIGLALAFDTLIPKLDKIIYKKRNPST